MFALILFNVVIVVLTWLLRPGSLFDEISPELQAHVSVQYVHSLLLWQRKGNYINLSRPYAPSIYHFVCHSRTSAAPHP
jgi:hypothetical protein